MYLYVCAVVASDTAVSDPVGARKLGHASIGLSVAGIIVTVVAVVIAVAVVTSQVADAVDSCRYTYYGTCYRNKDYVGTYSSCSGVRSSSGYCYYD